MVEELRRKLVPQGPGLAGFSGELTGSLPEMAQKSVPGLGVRGAPGGPDDRVDSSTRSRGQKGQKCIKTLPLRDWPEMEEVGIKDLKPELRTIFPEVRDLPIVETPWC